MKFVLGKELRTLGVFEFVLLIYDKFIHQCCYEKESHTNVSTIRSSSSVETTETGEQQMQRTNTEHTNATIAVRIYRIVNIVFKLLLLSIYLSVLLLLQKDLKQCNDPTSFVPINLGFVIIGFNILFWIISFEPFSSYFHEDEGPIGTEASVKLLSKCGRLLKPGKLSKTRKRLSAIGKWAKEHGNMVQRVLSAFGLVVVVVLTVSSITLYGLEIFFFLTSIRFAIPGQYMAECASDDLLIRNVMISIPMIVIINFSIKALGLIFNKIKAFRDSAAVQLLQMFVETFFEISTAILYIILSNRSTKIWSGDELSLYETIAMVASLPTIYVLLE